MYRHCKSMGPLIQHDYCDKRDKSRDRERKRNKTNRENYFRYTTILFLMIVKASLVKQDFVGQKAYCLLRIYTNICIFDGNYNLVWFPERHCRF